MINIRLEGGHRESRDSEKKIVFILKKTFFFKFCLFFVCLFKKYIVFNYLFVFFLFFFLLSRLLLIINVHSCGNSGNRSDF